MICILICTSVLVLTVTPIPPVYPNQGFSVVFPGWPWRARESSKTDAQVLKKKHHPIYVSMNFKTDHGSNMKGWQARFDMQSAI